MNPEIKRLATVLGDFGNAAFNKISESNVVAYIRSRNREDRLRVRSPTA